MNQLAFRFVLVVEWIDIYIIRCRFDWLCEPLQTISWYFAQQELNRGDNSQVDKKPWEA